MVTVLSSATFLSPKAPVADPVTLTLSPLRYRPSLLVAPLPATAAVPLIVALTPPSYTLWAALRPVTVSALALTVKVPVVTVPTL